MTDDELIFNWEDEPPDFPDEFKESYSRLIALARKGASVMPRPIEEAPRDGSTLIDTAGRAFHWGSIRGKEGFKWKHRGDDEWPWAETVGYFYAMSALPKPQVKP